MLTKEFLLKHGFKWREFEDNSRNNHSGEFELYKAPSYIVTVYWFEGEEGNEWNINILSIEHNREVKIRANENFPLTEFTDALKVCKIIL